MNKTYYQIPKHNFIFKITNKNNKLKPKLTYQPAFHTQYIDNKARAITEAKDIKLEANLQVVPLK